MTYSEMSDYLHQWYDDYKKAKKIKEDGERLRRLRDTDEDGAVEGEEGESIFDDPVFWDAVGDVLEDCAVVHETIAVLVETRWPTDSGGQEKGERPAPPPGAIPHVAMNPTLAASIGSIAVPSGPWA